MALTDYARKELELAGFFDEEAMYGGMLGYSIMELIEKFAEQGHSGMSASITLNAFNQVARFRPLTPLTGEPDEWTLVSGGFTAVPLSEPDNAAKELIYMINSAAEPEGLYQNKRCPRVFKDESGAYDTEGKVFREPNGSCFTSRDSRVYVTFPYTPTTEIVDVNRKD